MGFCLGHVGIGRDELFNSNVYRCAPKHHQVPVAYSQSSAVIGEKPSFMLVPFNFFPLVSSNSSFMEQCIPSQNRPCRACFAFLAPSTHIIYDISTAMEIYVSCLQLSSWCSKHYNLETENTLFICLLIATYLKVARLTASATGIGVFTVKRLFDRMIGSVRLVKPESNIEAPKRATIAAGMQRLNKLVSSYHYVLRITNNVLEYTLIYTQ